MPTETLRLSEGDTVDVVGPGGARHRGTIRSAPNPCFPTDYVYVDFGDPLAFRVIAAWVTRLPPPPDGTCRCAVAGPSRDCRVHGDGN